MFVSLVKKTGAVRSKGHISNSTYPAQKMKFSMNNFFSKCNQIQNFL